MSGAFVDYVKPNKSGILIFRRRFPQDLTQYIPRADGRGMGRKELCVSLLSENVDDKGVVERWQEAKAEYDRLVCEAQKGAVVSLKQSVQAYDALTPPDIAYLAETFRQETLEQDDEARWDKDERALFKSVAVQVEGLGGSLNPNWTGREGSRWAAKARANIEALLPNLREMRANGDLKAIVSYWREEALDLALAHNFVLDPADDHVLEALCRAVNDAAISASMDRLKRLDGVEYPETPIAPVRAAPSLPVQSSSKVPLLDVFEGYADAQGISVNVRKEWKRYITIFTEFMGHSDAARITRDDVSGWRDHLLVTPNRTGRLRKPVTVRDKYLMALGCTLGWAVEERLLASNPAREVKVRVPRATKLRDKNYTLDEARSILKASLEPAGASLPVQSARARRWLPWLCAYSGARVGELAQLRKEDIKQEDGIWMLRVTPDAGTVKTKQARSIPIHSHLIEQGFLEEVRRLPEGPIFYNPENRRAGEDTEENRHVKKVGERLAMWVRKTVGIIDPEIKPNHAWRHLFTTLAEEAGIPERTYMAIQGHAASNVSRNYGATTAKAKFEAMENFPRFEIYKC